MAEHQAGVGEGSGDDVLGPALSPACPEPRRGVEGPALGDDFVEGPQNPGVEGHGQNLGVVAAVDENLSKAEGGVDVGRRCQQGWFCSQNLSGEEVHPQAVEQETEDRQQFDGCLEIGPQDVEEPGDEVGQRGGKIEKGITVAKG